MKSISTISCVMYLRFWNAEKSSFLIWNIPLNQYARKIDFEITIDGNKHLKIFCFHAWKMIRLGKLGVTLRSCFGNARVPLNVCERSQIGDIFTTRYKWDDDTDIEGNVIKVCHDYQPTMTLILKKGSDSCLLHFKSTF